MTATTPKTKRRATKAMQPSPHRRPPPAPFRPFTKARKLTRDELRELFQDAARNTAKMQRKAS